MELQAAAATATVGRAYMAAAESAGRHGILTCCWSTAKRSRSRLLFLQSGPMAPLTLSTSTAAGRVVPVAAVPWPANNTGQSASSRKNSRRTIGIAVTVTENARAGEPTARDFSATRRQHALWWRTCAAIIKVSLWLCFPYTIFQRPDQRRITSTLMRNLKCLHRPRHR